MQVGTKSVLFGYHAIWLHGWMVALAWWKLYGFPSDIRLWFSFFLHDIGYWGKPNMDGVQGKLHPKEGARLMGRWFDSRDSVAWYYFTVNHSRYMADAYHMKVSALCVADKLAVIFYPTWLLVILYTLSGEGKEYLANDEKRWNVKRSLTEWIEHYKTYTKEWVSKNRDNYDDYTGQGKNR